MANTVIWANNDSTTLASSLSSSATTATLVNGASFPTPASGQFTPITLISATNPLTFEIVYCTIRSGNTITITRAREGTTALAFNAGDLVQNLVTAGTVALLVQPSEPWTWSATQTYSISPVLNNNIGIIGKSTGGASTTMLNYNSSNYVGMYGGIAGFSIGNNAASANNMLMDDTGNVTFRGGIVSSAVNPNGFSVEFGTGTYCSGWRNDGNYTFLLLTGSSGGTYNSLRPFYTTNATGAVTIDGTGAGTTFGGPATVNGTFTTTNINYLNSGLSVMDGIQIGSATPGWTGPIGTLTPGVEFLGTGYGSSEIFSNNANHVPLELGVNYTFSSGDILGFYYNTTHVGGVQTDGTYTLYTGTSDANLKIKRSEIANSGEIIDGIEALWFNWRTNPDGTQQPGFFAQQLHSVYPWAVVPGKGLPGDDDFRAWSIDKSVLMPVVIAELKDCRQRIAALEAAIAKLLDAARDA